MISLAKTILYDSGIPSDLFAACALKIGDKEWWDAVGIEPPSLAEERSGMMCIKATRLLLLVCNMLSAWSISNEDAYHLLGLDNKATFLTVVTRARKILFIGTYIALAIPRDLAASQFWLNRPNKNWNGATALEVMQDDSGGLDRVIKHLEGLVSPVTYLTEDMQ